MKKYIKASEYEDRMVFTRSGTRYAVYMNDCSEKQPVCKFKMAGIHPYDDADYAWAVCDGAVVNYYRGQRKIGSNVVMQYDPDDYEEYSEYIYELVDSTAVTLRDYNKDVKPKIIHN